MKTRAFLAATLGIGLLAGDVQAQSLLEGMARRALTSAAGEALERAIVGRAQAPAPDADPSAGVRRSSRSQPVRDDAPEAEGMQGLSPEDRSRACAARYPTRDLTGDAYMQRSSQHAACMGPGWGEGG